MLLQHSHISSSRSIGAGTPLRAWFAEIRGEHQDDQVLALQQRCLPCGIFERNDSVLHVIRATGVRYASSGPTAINHVTSSHWWHFGCLLNHGRSASVPKDWCCGAAVGTHCDLFVLRALR